eukprot:11188920-Lingulodinium_polyedra.AAC.1
MDIPTSSTSLRRAPRPASSPRRSSSPRLVPPTRSTSSDLSRSCSVYIPKAGVAVPSPLRPSVPEA